MLFRSRNIILQENGSQEQHNGNRTLGNVSNTIPPAGGNENRGGNQPPNGTVPTAGSNNNKDGNQPPNSTVPTVRGNNNRDGNQLPNSTVLTAKGNNNRDRSQPPNSIILSVRVNQPLDILSTRPRLYMSRGWVYNNGVKKEIIGYRLYTSKY